MLPYLNLILLALVSATPDYVYTSLLRDLHARLAYSLSPRGYP